MNADTLCCNPNRILSWNALTSLPAGIFNRTTTLQYLYGPDELHRRRLFLIVVLRDLDNNQLTSLPSSLLDTLTSLQHLCVQGALGILHCNASPFRYLFSNNLTSLPIVLFENLQMCARDVGSRRCKNARDVMCPSMLFFQRPSPAVTPRAILSLAAVHSHPVLVRQAV